MYVLLGVAPSVTLVTSPLSPSTVEVLSLPMRTMTICPTSAPAELDIVSEVEADFDELLPSVFRLAHAIYAATIKIESPLPSVIVCGCTGSATTMLGIETMLPVTSPAAFEFARCIVYVPATKFGVVKVFTPYDTNAPPGVGPSHQIFMPT